MVGFGETPADDVEGLEKIEIEFWRNPRIESSAANSIENLLNQVGDARLFWEKLAEYWHYFERAQTIVELGAGQGWASCILKKLWPEKTIHATDISPGALSVTPVWQRIFRVRLDGAYACRSYCIPFRSESIDLVFCFQAAHHFRRQEKTLVELKRILRGRGTALYLHEPGSRRWCHSVARRRLVDRRPNFPEDVLLYPHIASLAAKMGFETRVNFVPTTTNKDVLATVYFYLLRKGWLPKTILPCIIDVVLTKQNGACGTGRKIPCF